MVYTGTKVERLNVALRNPDVAWAYHHVLTPHDKAEMDRLLVEIKHPLAYLAGSNESRFRTLHAVGFRFDARL